MLGAFFPGISELETTNFWGEIWLVTNLESESLDELEYEEVPDHMDLKWFKIFLIFF